MLVIKKIIFFLFITATFWSCEKNLSQSAESIDGHAQIHQELLSIEYAIWIQDYEGAINHSRVLDVLLTDGYNLFCPNESAQIDGARMTNHILVQHIDEGTSHDLLDDLRILKGTIINLVSDDDYDPYFAFLWQFEEDMHATTQIAMDPMLNLYEWNEFTDIANCMNESWQPLKMHFPSSEILGNDPVKFKHQTIHKIYLEKALEKFNLAIETADYEQYPLCDTAEGLRQAYVEYIKTFINYNKKLDSFLATL